MVITPAQGSSSTGSILIVVPWLEGGGAQGALSGLLKRLPSDRLTLVILFAGSRNHTSVTDLVCETVEFNCPRTIAGVIQASQRLRSLVRSKPAIYSLMRASHLVLGLLPSRLLRDKRLVATFHQLPSQDSSGPQGWLEDILVKKGIRSAGLVTAPSRRAVSELVEGKYSKPEITHVEQNLFDFSDNPVQPARRGRLQPLRLLFAGRLTNQKGLDRIPELFKELRTPVHLICLGDGEERPHILSLVKDLPDPHKVELISHVDNLEPYLDWCDALFMPSRWELNPLVIWEARARGRAAIATNIDVFRDLASTGPMWLFSDAAGFAEVVESVSKSYDLRSQAVVSAVESIRTLNTRSSIVEYLDK